MKARRSPRPRCPGRVIIASPRSRVLAEGKFDVFQRLSGVALAKQLRPVTAKPPFEGRSGAMATPSAPSGSVQPPSEPEIGPACAAQSQDGRLRVHAERSAWRVEQQPAIAVPAAPMMPWPELHAHTAQPPKPGAQQWRGFQALREDAPARSRRRSPAPTPPRKPADPAAGTLQGRQRRCGAASR